MERFLTFIVIKPFQYFNRLDIERGAYLNELNNIKPPLAAFVLRDVRLRLAKTTRDIRLGEVICLASFD